MRVKCDFQHSIVASKSWFKVSKIVEIVETMTLRNELWLKSFREIWNIIIRKFCKIRSSCIFDCCLFYEKKSAKVS